MAYSKSERYTLPFDGQLVRLPAVVQEYHNLGYNDGVEVTLYPEIESVDSLTFTAWVNSSARITIPSAIRNRFRLGDKVELSFEAMGERWSPEVGASARKAVYESAHPDEQSMEAVTDIVAQADD